MSVTPDAVIVVSDTHIGSTVGLSPPTVSLDDGGMYNASPPQRELWKCWVDFWQWAAEQSKGHRRIVVFNGDIIETDAKSRGIPMATRNKADLLTMAIEAIGPALEVSDLTYVIRGTQAHTGQAAEFEELLARDITNISPSTKKVKS